MRLQVQISISTCLQLHRGPNKGRRGGQGGGLDPYFAFQTPTHERGELTSGPTTTATRSPLQAAHHHYHPFITTSTHPPLQPLHHHCNPTTTTTLHPLQPDYLHLNPPIAITSNRPPPATTIMSRPLWSFVPFSSGSFRVASHKDTLYSTIGHLFIPAAAAAATSGDLIENGTTKAIQGAKH